MESTLDLRPSPIAGQWYSSDPQRLAASVDGFIEQAKLPPLSGQVMGIIAPHAGHIYSGPVAGYAFATLRGLQPELVAVVSPMHHPYHQALLTTAHNAYQTPLGSLPVDADALQTLDAQLKELLGTGLAYVKQDPEHSLEIELPFLQRIIPKGFRLLPVMVRDQNPNTIQALGLALAKTLQGRNALLVASTDLSHFYPERLAQALDAEMLRRIETFDPQAVLSAEDEGVGFACGRGAVAAVLWAARELGADTVQVLHHATSGNVTGDYSQVVGYGAAVILRKK
ncbi:MAG: AmmeMemoRadiSam system protein B [Anaerolineales bacterium]|nr:AmmeMemoRadiSam system protein B [Anaerolineales bacterium]